LVKPSIFSRDYEKQMKKRRNKIVLGISISVIIIMFVVVSMKGIFKNSDKDMGNLKNIVTTDKENIKSTEVKNPDVQSSEKIESSEKSKVQKLDGYDIQLGDGKTITVVYEVKNNDKVFKKVIPVENKVLYSISPLGKNIVIFDDKMQNIILVDIYGNKQDITNFQYTSTSGTVITKAAQLSTNPNYIWCSSPKFIDEDNIAYISQLPWIGKTTKYVWIENLKEKTHTFVQGIEGEDLKLESLTDRGLTVNVGGRTVFLTSDGNISE